MWSSDFRALRCLQFWPPPSLDCGTDDRDSRFSIYTFTLLGFRPKRPNCVVLCIIFIASLSCLTQIARTLLRNTLLWHVVICVPWCLTPLIGPARLPSCARSSLPSCATVRSRSKLVRCSATLPIDALAVAACPVATCRRRFALQSPPSALCRCLVRSRWATKTAS
jgi:hypothetical protein